MQSLKERILKFIDEFYNKSNEIVSDAYFLMTCQDWDYDKNKQKEITAILQLICFKYENELTKDQFSTFSDFLLEFFIRIFLQVATKHKLYNGNKRMATCLLFYCLKEYEEDVMFDYKDLLKDIKELENKILEVINDYSNTKEEDRIVQNIKNWIKSKKKTLKK